MKLIVGLGNPGQKYEGTRHNAGFLFLNILAGNKALAPVDEELIFSNEKKFEAEIAELSHKGEKIILAKPQTFMNLSGTAVNKIMQFYKINPPDLIVISDDIDLPVGTVRVRPEGTSGGQRGLQNIIETIGSDKFLRIRIGVRPTDENLNESDLPAEPFDATQLVLSKFDGRELHIINEVIDDAIDYILPFLGGKEEIPSHSIKY